MFGINEPQKEYKKAVNTLKKKVKKWVNHIQYGIK
jgi:hypothetical protein